ncbi:hypothetical protein AUG19_02265 [archaeon 13_1_20CM_2_54_9]|nr:MAG: hypothetical protein AUJ07_03925 [Crenarchaeota archaeon 13_1_40CM_3_53_5]OLE76671.1 MAG: hypothetical protein AUG19_02265 [archaeon 13_1_20CM_2_54_9]
MKILQALLVIVIGLGLVGTVATSTSTASTALAAFTGAQSLVIIIPLLFVAIILFAAYRHVSMGGGKKELALDMRKGHDGIWTFNLKQRKALIPKL